jgi:hypothetical protein
MRNAPHRPHFFVLVVVLLRSPTVLVPPVVTPQLESGSCLLLIALPGLLLLGKLVLGGNAA